MGKVIPTAGFRRASQPDPATVAAFVELDDAPGDTPAPAALSVVPDASPTTSTPKAAVAAPMSVPARTDANAARWRRKTIQRADGRELRKQTFYLDAELSHRLAVLCAQRQFDLSEAIEEAVEVWLRSQNAQ